MNGIISLLKTVYHKNKLLFLIVLVGIAIFIAGCSSQSGSPPPSGPIGGGCG